MRKFTLLIEPITKIWTGDINEDNSNLRETGILGSIRWWYEALIRALEGSACDPTSNAKTERCNRKNHCDTCELFGCTGWSRKFRLSIEERNPNFLLHFQELRKINSSELVLLNKTLRLIADYGSLGARIAKSNGLIRILNNDFEKFNDIKRTIIREYFCNKGNSVRNPNINRFIFINKNESYPKIKEIKNNLKFLKGYKGKGKRYFLKFYNKQPYRFFAYAENKDEYREIVNYLNRNNISFIEGTRLLEELF